MEPVTNQLRLLQLTSGVVSEENEIINNYETQVQLFQQERMQVSELWQTAAQELDHLQESYWRMFTNGLNSSTPGQQLIQSQTNCNFSKTMTGHSAEVEDLQIQLRSTKAELRTATAKVDEMTHQLQSVQQQLKRQEGNEEEAQSREEAAQRQIQQLQRTISHQETKIKDSSQETETALKDLTMWETAAGNLKVRCATLEQEKYEGLEKVRECVQMAEEAALQKDEAQLRAKQLSEELERTKKAFQQLSQDATVCSNEELNNIRQQCNTEMQTMAEELSLLHLECVDKQSQIERFKRERKALEEEVAKVTKCKVEHELGRIDALHQKCLKAEQMKDEISTTLQRTRSKLKKLESDYSAELSRYQEEVQTLKGFLNAAREDCVRISAERLQLQQENVHFRREMDELRKATLQVQKNAKQQITQMEQEYSVKEKALKAQMTDLEESNRNSSADLMRLLTAQQKSIQRWKVEAPNMAQAFETRIKNLTDELNQYQQRSHVFEIQLMKNNDTIVEYERQLSEFREKVSRLQRRLAEVEQRTTPSQQARTLPKPPAHMTERSISN
ncbi:sodium channel and clathrin linker 1-like isoform X1 [Syngnathoides biaculeatus]|uniref:sodium channel and clathrin linker 1-like isoform X1 n=1 Tax=Syngnathoides biaculeatus TaxID=300417 RepID=UPI002ADD7B39|nr:sodium channel and clathrin linker 1-like isoform X1 [Syngnathoides biaculeatus]XP_061685811.1 sodium channel and clathrin linker 1-like isoform X1 [Syngnathoides biaculeatus]